MRSIPVPGSKGVEVGDELVVAIDTDLAMALVDSDGAELIDRFIDGDAWGLSKVLDAATTPDGL